MANSATNIGKIKLLTTKYKHENILYVFEEIFNFEVDDLWSSVSDDDNQTTDLFEITFYSSWNFPVSKMQLMSNLLNAKMMFVSFELSNDYVDSFIIEPLPDYLPKEFIEIAISFGYYIDKDKLEENKNQDFNKIITSVSNCFEKKKTPVVIDLEILTQRKKKLTEQLKKQLSMKKTMRSPHLISELRVSINNLTLWIKKI